MADVDSSGSLVGSRTQVIPLFNAAQTEGSSEALQTDSNFVGSVTSAGTYAAQLQGGFMMTRGGITAENEISVAWIRSAGRCKIGVPVGSTGLGGDNLPASVPYPKALVPGDEVMVTAQTAASRAVGLVVACTNGEYHPFEVTPSGSGEHELISTITSQSIGQVLQNRVVSHAYATGGNNNSNFTSPIYILDGSGIPIGAIQATDLSSSSAVFSPLRAAITLNSRAVFRTDA